MERVSNTPRLSGREDSVDKFALPESAKKKLIARLLTPKAVGCQKDEPYKSKSIKIKKVYTKVFFGQSSAFSMNLIMSISLPGGCRGLDKSHIGKTRGSWPAGRILPSQTLVQTCMVLPSFPPPITTTTVLALPLLLSLPIGAGY